MFQPSKPAPEKPSKAQRSVACVLATALAATHVAAQSAPVPKAEPATAPTTAPTTAAPAPPTGNPLRGRGLLLQRFETGCILCHQLPGLPQGGNLGPSLEHVKTRWTPAELRTRIADARRFNPQTIMPPYRSTEGLTNVAPAYAGKAVLSEQALEDIVAYLTQSDMRDTSSGSGGSSSNSPSTGRP